MKYMLAAVVAVVCMGGTAHAKSEVKKKKINLIKAGQMKNRAVDWTYFGPVAVGRVSPLTWQVELIGLTADDPNSTTVPKRKVKTVLDVSPVDPMDPVQVEEAWTIIGYFIDTKLGFTWDENNIKVPVSKVTTVAYDHTVDSTVDNVCLGLDLEIANQTTPATKECYHLRPVDIIESSL